MRQDLRLTCSSRGHGAFTPYSGRTPTTQDQAARDVQVAQVAQARAEQGQADARQALEHASP
ncbi:hypothetical protein [Nonomuraea sp. NPDC049784]|uniref:hypothetical protein n=1 Tax=Nonomuraea sp. NPDC049784 TaxID=3154361 RepID=UPI00340829C4